MPSQAPDVRNKNFSEVALGYTREMAVGEAKRCLNCKNKPCVAACPVRIDIPAFIERVAHEDFEGAYEVLSRSTSLPAVCGRVCPQETQCEGKCVRGIKGEAGGHRPSGALCSGLAPRSETRPLRQKPAPNGHKVAVIGAGPQRAYLCGRSGQAWICCDDF